MPQTLPALLTFHPSILKLPFLSENSRDKKAKKARV